MIIEKQIREHLVAAFNPLHLQVINQSHQHAAGSAESHFKVILASRFFNGQARLQRHRAVYQVLRTLLAEKVHALALHLYDDVEWTSCSQQIPPSPSCFGRAETPAKHL